MPGSKTRRAPSRKSVRIARTKTVRGRRGVDEAQEIPAMPAPDSLGRVNALQYIRGSIARDLLARRQAAGLTQQKLAQLANVRQETVSRIECAKHTVTPRILDKLMRAFDRAARK